ncbi:hypothetical protein RA086_09500 [Lactiplantibacillus sp. WILCCON 0030]|uniref:Uncharacterized protein n=1 Tax=Lactiplantibacillus brownii TaxID=3069269 RepID=A0ABU1AAD5_9LACO|nr:hypothetical protein [Lactiplantibacillus brownii]MDQ7937843.1 hypothetical protein [Lactiplantibacillus brownii]
MRLYQPLAKHNGRVPHHVKVRNNPFYGTHGADWVKNESASLFNAEHEHSQAHLHLQRRVGQATYNVIWMVLAVIGMLLGGFIIYSLAINL